MADDHYQIDAARINFIIGEIIKTLDGLLQGADDKEQEHLQQIVAVTGFLRVSASRMDDRFIKMVDGIVAELFANAIAAGRAVVPPPSAMPAAPPLHALPTQTPMQTPITHAPVGPIPKRRRKKDEDGSTDG